MTESKATVSRRTFVTGSLAGLAVASATGALYGCTPAADDDLAATGEGAETAPDTVAWSQCVVNCGGACALQWHIRDGKIAYAETDNVGDPNGLQARACLRGRSLRRWINSPDRLQHPMKRVGKRGEANSNRSAGTRPIRSLPTS